MTIGERIQFYRKQSGLSQEELSQKLLVSRQTVSLWENDQTLPTIDNLIRLKEIFGVSVDYLLGEEETETENSPLEAYAFSFNESELQSIAKIFNFNLLKRIIIVSVCLLIVILITPAETDVPDESGFAFSMFMFGIVLCSLIVSVSQYFSSRKGWKQTILRMCRNEYKYSIFDDRLIVSVCINNEEFSKQIIFFHEITHCWETAEYYMFQGSDLIYIIKKSALTPNSALYPLFNDKKASVLKVDTKKQNALKIVGLLFFFGSIGTLWGALHSVSALSDANHLFLENTWVFYAFLPIPTASIIIGFFLKKNGIKYKKNIVVGIIMSFLLVAYGSFSLISAELFDHSEEYVLTVEERTGIDIPTAEYITTEDFTIGEQSGTSSNVFYYRSEIVFNQEAAANFENTLKHNEKWMKNIPTNYIGILPSLYNPVSAEYTLIYNLDTEQFNTLPGKNGEYKLICITYNSENCTMVIYEYSISYIK